MNSIIKFRYAIIALLMIVINGVGAFASTPWTINPSDYRYDMTLYLDVKIASQQMDYSQYEVAVFCGNECRGIAEPLSLGNGKECLYLRVRSNVESGETMTFKYYDKEAGKIFSIPDVSIQFESNEAIGYPSDPYVIDIDDTQYFELTFSAGKGGSVDQESGSYAEGTELVVTATPIEGYSFDQWTDGVKDNPRTLVVDKNLSLVAEFSVNSYSLTYMLDGETYKEFTIEYGSEIASEASPEKEGYTFSGWEGLPTTMPAHDVVVNGSFQVNSYNAVFKIGEEIIETKTIAFGQPVVSPEAPAKEGYTFNGWQNVPETMPAKDIEILGSYTVNQYKLTYVVDGQSYKEYSLDYGTAIMAEAEPEKEGHTFSGWDGVPETMPAHDVTVKGTFVINSYKAVFKIDGEVFETKTIVYGSPVVAPDAPAKEGYTFGGWQNVPETMPARDIEILGSYSVNQYKLTYVVDGKTYKEYSLDCGVAITAEAEPEKEGYTFSGWEGLPKTMPAHDVTVKGTFAINSYKAVFKIDDKVIDTKTIVYGDPVVAPEGPAKEGYTFAGWKDLPATMPARDIEVVGYYALNQYKLIYVVDGETYREYSVENGSVITPEAEPEKEGYTFSGWEGVPKTMPSHDVTVKGSFTINSYKAVFKIDDKVIDTKTIVYGDPVVAPDAPAMEGYSFGGWQNVPATMPAKDIEIVGSYAINQYKLTYTVDGKTYKEYSVVFGTAITAETEPSKEGYSFSGWEGVPATMPAHDVTVKGNFTINSYKAIFKIDGEVIESKSIVYGDPVDAPEIPEKEGYSFAGWKDLPTAMPAHDIEVTGNYEVNYYILSVYLNDELIYSENLAYGSDVVIEEPDVPEGMKFDGWTTEIPDSMPAHDVEIYGSYSEVDAVLQIELGDSEEVTVCDLSGQILHHKVLWRDVREKISKGIYIINGIKHLIK